MKAPDKEGWWQLDYHSHYTNNSLEKVYYPCRQVFEVYAIPTGMLCAWHEDYGVDCNGYEGPWDGSEWVGHIPCYVMEGDGEFTFLGTTEPEKIGEIDL